MRKTEAQIQMMVADYLRLRYPDVVFHSDFGSGVKLSISQATTQKRLNGGKRGWPDMFIAEARDCYLDMRNEFTGEASPMITHYNGLFLELKSANVKIYKKDDSLVADNHIREQFDLHEELRRRGYCAEFACGFDEAKRIIDLYLKGGGITSYEK